MENYISNGWKIHRYDDGINMECFKPETGEWRGSFIDSNKNPTKNYPFLRSFPYSINVRLSDNLQSIDHIRLKEALSEASEKGTFFVDFVYKTGEPIHPYLIDILDYTVKLQILPLVAIYTEHLDNDLLEFAKSNLCEINLMSYNGFEPVKDVFYTLIDNNIKTILNLVLNDDTINSIINAINSNDEHFLSPSFNYILLCRTPSKSKDPGIKKKYDELYKLIQGQKSNFVTFDKCAKNDIISHNVLKTCICGRRTLYIDYDLKAKPCKRDYNNRFSVDLHTHTLEEAWNSEEFKSFRELITCDENMIEKDNQSQLLITKCPLLD